MKTVLIKTDNTIQVLEVQKNSGWEEFQRITGLGFAEFVRPILEPQLIIVCDDEGLLKRLKCNLLASHLYGTSRHGQVIVGDVILMKPVMTSDGPDFSFFEDKEIPDLMKKLKKRTKALIGKFTFIEEVN